MFYTRITLRASVSYKRFKDPANAPAPNLEILTFFSEDFPNTLILFGKEELGISPFFSVEKLQSASFISIF